MARGWESKSVEEQIEMAAEKAASLKNASQVDEAEAARRPKTELARITDPQL